MKGYHFDLGDTMDGALGLSAWIPGATKEEALDRLRTILRQVAGVSGELPVWSEGNEYVNIYLNPRQITVEDSDFEDER